MTGEGEIEEARHMCHYMELYAGPSSHLTTVLVQKGLLKTQFNSNHLGFVGGKRVLVHSRTPSLLSVDLCKIICYIIFYNSTIVYSR